MGGPRALPARGARALADSGNVPYGAFDGAETIGYVLGWVGVDPEDGLLPTRTCSPPCPIGVIEGRLRAQARAARAGARPGDRRGPVDVDRSSPATATSTPAQAGRGRRSLRTPNHYGAMVDEVNAGERSDRFTVDGTSNASRARGRGRARGALEDDGGWRATSMRRPGGGRRRGPERLRKASDRGCRPRVGVARRVGPCDRGLSHGRDDRGGVRPRFRRATRSRWRRTSPVTRIRSIELRLVAIPLVRPFRTSFGESTEKVCILARGDRRRGRVGGVRERRRAPLLEEWNDGAWLTIRDFLAPALFAAGDVEAELVASVLSFVRGHPMAKATLVNAVLDAELRAQGRSLASYLGAVRDRVECGVSVGIALDDALLEQVGATSPRATAASSSRSSRAPTSNASARSGRRTPRSCSRWTRTPPIGSRRRSLPAARCVRPADDRAAVAPRGSVGALATPAGDPDRYLSGRVDPLGRGRPGGDRARGVPDREHQAGRVGGLLEARRVHDVASELGVPVWCGGCSRPGSVVRRTSRWPRSRTSGCPATRARPRGTSPRT